MTMRLQETERVRRFVELCRTLFKEAKPRAYEGWPADLPMEDKILGVFLEALIGERPDGQHYRGEAAVVLKSLQSWKTDNGNFTFSNRDKLVKHLSNLYSLSPIHFVEYRRRFFAQFREKKFPGHPSMRFGNIVANILLKYSSLVRGSQYQYFTGLRQFERIYDNLDERIPAFESRLFKWDFLERIHRHSIFMNDEVDLTPRSIHLAEGGKPGIGVSVVFDVNTNGKVKIGYLGDKLAQIAIEDLPEEEDKATVWFEVESLLCNLQKEEPFNVRTFSKQYFGGQIDLDEYWNLLKRYYEKRLTGSGEQTHRK